ncbi:hypothetical protein MJO28_016542 [Puccinia striiformis f. sp. tritici]|uniref:Uncharacterized protein n=1 Tax=Puccinia striiformis f. sp. tritici TaxID=168172 RepID=A0ACC0DNU8_9BASI|nr:hypothetical protein Pst134EA_030378 [Puccinia striiformis f. sp. tritici]KAI9599961.1 hypothetical protein KEM48_000073 [Puccinia striiformis f. sp. tritici PST-130]KAH9440289.1 hypothetical protein Pst134EB_030910 [Puccinia striiformis f. sp. tritici]KAH9446460.1 hypothetical protein Pst134EA_030378 [Puccinia striiformis f. sp. tritici]KAI7934830.1 hypothetical protein MJO29_016093 [Puccinia striiformis f. sp. tritici]KAI7935671.1 hypothetical protein MJO28_016542 [Puccinia striiformis f.
MSSSLSILVKVALVGFFMSLPGVFADCAFPYTISACSRNDGVFIKLNLCRYGPGFHQFCCKTDPLIYKNGGADCRSDE